LGDPGKLRIIAGNAVKALQVRFLTYPIKGLTNVGWIKGLKGLVNSRFANQAIVEPRAPDRPQIMKGGKIMPSPW